MKALKGLYAITDEQLTPYDTIENYIIPVLKNGANLVQLRDKSHSTEELIPVAKKIHRLCKEYNSYFIVNDNFDLAKAIDADGLHIGKTDVSLREVRKELPDKIIGASCYDDLERAEKMEKDGASYVAFGSFFPSPTKPQSRVVDKNVLKLAKKRLSIPPDGRCNASVLNEFLPEMIFHFQ